eukprot:3281369-Rhodomonas_salina.2
MGHDMQDIASEVGPDTEVEELSRARDMVGVGHDCEVVTPSVHDKDEADAVTAAEPKHPQIDKRTPHPAAENPQNSMSKV